MTTPLFIVGLSGPDRVGKSTTADRLIEEGARAGLKVVRLSFADPLYAAASAILDMPVVEIKARKMEVFTEDTAPLPFLVGKTLRWFLRILGTEAGRERIDTNIWSQAAAKRARRASAMGAQVVVFDDCRFDNEARECGLVVELSRPGVTYTYAHASDCGLPGELVSAHLSTVRGPIAAGEDLLNLVLGHRGGAALMTAG